MQRLLSIVSFLVAICVTQAEIENNFNRIGIQQEYDPADGNLTVPEIIVKYGYPLEVHKITTEDGYILTVHRIPYGKDSGPAPNKPVVWLQHGLMGDSSSWIFNGET